MKKIAWIILSLTATLAGCDHKTPPTTVKNVDVSRYMGTWYELASLPAWFQRGCYCTKAQYEWKGDWMQVTNSCMKGDRPGKLKEAKAKAWAVPGSFNAKFKVQFFKPFKGDYWILYVDKDYQHAIVGAPDYEYLWLLSRKRHTSVGEFLALKHIAEQKGYDVNKLRLTDQSCAIKKKVPTKL